MKLLERFHRFIARSGVRTHAQNVAGLKSAALDHSAIRAFLKSLMTYSGQPPDQGLEPWTTSLKGWRSTD